MGSYRRKEYKKKTINKNQKKNFDDILKNEIDIFIKEKENQDNFLSNREDLIMLNEPDIIKELREEEREGKLQKFLIDETKEDNQILTEISPKVKKNSYIEPNIIPNKIKIRSYKDALALAKKVLFNINKK